MDSPIGPPSLPSYGPPAATKPIPANSIPVLQNWKSQKPMVGMLGKMLKPKLKAAKMPTGKPGKRHKFKTTGIVSMPKPKYF